MPLGICATCRRPIKDTFHKLPLNLGRIIFKDWCKCGQRTITEVATKWEVEKLRKRLANLSGVYSKFAGYDIEKEKVRDKFRIMMNEIKAMNKRIENLDKKIFKSYAHKKRRQTNERNDTSKKI